MLLYPIFALSTALTVSSFILGASMMADVVEESQSRTGRRNEGVFFAGSFFVQKCTSGLGIAVAGSILALAGLQDKIDPATASPDKVDHLVLMFILIYGSLATSPHPCSRAFRSAAPSTKRDWPGWRRPSARARRMSPTDDHGDSADFGENLLAVNSRGQDSYEPFKALIGGETPFVVKGSIDRRARVFMSDLST